MKYYMSPRWSGEILDCAMPMTFDTYSRCSYNCRYCFGIFQKASRKSSGRGTFKEPLTCQPVQHVNVDAIQKLFTLQTNSQFNGYIRAGLTMQWGGLTDPFCNFEKKHGITLKLMEFFKSINYPLRFSTKATWWLDDPRYTDLIRGQKNWVFMFSIINLDPKVAAKVEAGVPSPQERLEAIRKIAELDCAGAVLRLRPFIIGMSDTNGDHIKLIEQAAGAGASAVSTEFFCLEQRSNETVKKSYQIMADALGFDIVGMYKKLSKGGGYLRLNRNVKAPFIADMKAACDRVGLKFHVSDAHHKEQGCTGACCGLPPDMPYNKGQFTEALMIAKENGVVYWSDIAPDAELFKHFLWRNATGFNTNNQVNRVKRSTQTMYEYVRAAWNTPNSLHSPYKYFGGVLRPEGIDDEGNVIYKYDRDLAL